MGCALYRSKRMSLYESKEITGAPHGGWSSRKGTPEQVLAWEIEQEKSIMVGDDDSVGFINGPGVKACVYCGFVADLLCDFPVGRGKTCDLDLCDECGFQVGEDLHVCKIHRKAYEGLSEVRGIRQGPKRRAR